MIRFFFSLTAFYMIFFSLTAFYMIFLTVYFSSFPIFCFSLFMYQRFFFWSRLCPGSLFFRKKIKHTCVINLQIFFNFIIFHFLCFKFGSCFFYCYLFCLASFFRFSFDILILHDFCFPIKFDSYFFIDTFFS
jgi:hypothetical protein